MLTIDRMTLRLPASLRGRAEGIARLVGAALADPPRTQSRRIGRLEVPEIVVHSATSDADIARTIATAIDAGIAGHGHTSERR